MSLANTSGSGVFDTTSWFVQVAKISLLIWYLLALKQRWLYVNFKCLGMFKMYQMSCKTTRAYLNKKKKGIQMKLLKCSSIILWRLGGMVMVRRTMAWEAIVYCQHISIDLLSPFSLPVCLEWALWCKIRYLYCQLLRRVNNWTDMFENTLRKGNESTEVCFFFKHVLSCLHRLWRQRICFTLLLNLQRMEKCLVSPRCQS